FYGELVALSGSKGYCWAKDTHFATLFDKSAKSISRWMKKLVKLGYIRLVKNREMFDRREIHLVSLIGTIEGHDLDTHVSAPGQTRPQNTGSLYIDKNDIHNVSYNDESKWVAHTSSEVNNNSFSFFNGATPTVEQVRACMQELPEELTAGVDLVEEARKFYVNYTATGWMMGSAKMKSLPAAVEKWITLSHNFNSKKANSNEHNSKYTFKQSPYTHLHAKQYDGDKF
uniref:helix-turn-helix domain-containing protein n=1 Tax=Pontibacter vulgaris TaxID=2905679 RepID=UPI001FA7C4D5